MDETAAAAVLGAGFLGYLTYTEVVAPDSSCGCPRKRRTPVTWRIRPRRAGLDGGAARHPGRTSGGRRPASHVNA
jgi:hypothetical protein